ncbi:cellulase family glycosylhydrolase [Desertivirga brevis]|uniref:cellulase family glycosylhydrolase n=1 Tax=Desertivirga brevis TaxID=2810310 RepID=UPI001A971B04|nr:cellulase family glycosylhydrolase [Pedobacter sp. SYSU D00873]
MTAKKLFIFLFLSTVLSVNIASAQDDKGVYVDANGVMRWRSTQKEAAFFGVNYTVPFAYGYRSHKVLGVNIEEAIRQDVYHMARLGLNAFRVHVWDTEISDSVGNLLENDHLRLFDFLIAELKKRGIKTLVTPIAFWGNGYPENDEKTPSWVSKYGKGPSVVKEEAIRAQENYLKQFFKHVNPYTKLSYKNDPDIIATEINNEPHHSGPKSGAKDYVNRLADAIRSTGWTKPVFYNISESPYYSDAVANANIDGVSFQWYPSGLVAGHTLKGNFLPNVDRYHIPFDSIPAFKNKAKMVYEFDAGDILQPVMYPAMARSFRTAGFQWATQFAYDPMATAFANTEYQTHYLNLAYTPSKAISLLIASKVFNKVPRLKKYGTYPTNNNFETFRINYKEGLSEMNSGEEFYYSNSTASKPVDASKLRKIAGVGSSSVVTYNGTGAYFLDQAETGVWRLEVMPDAISIRDPFAKASLAKEVTRIEWRNQEMTVRLKDLGADFQIKPLNKGNSFNAKVANNTFRITPGTYLLVEKKKKVPNAALKWSGNVGLNEFVAPEGRANDVFIKHTPFSEISEGVDFKVTATITGLTAGSKVTLLLNQLSGEYKTVEMQQVQGYEYSALVPASFVIPGLINYRIAVKQGDQEIVFPGGHKGNPWAWDNYNNETWRTHVAAKGSSLKIFDAGTDLNIRRMPQWDKNVKTTYLTSDKGSQLQYRLKVDQYSADKIAGFQEFIADKLEGRLRELEGFSTVRLKAKALSDEKGRMKITLINTEGQAYSTFVDLPAMLSDLNIPLKAFKPNSSLLLPRPYPGFQALWSPANAPTKVPVLQDIEKLEITVNPDLKATGFDIESVELVK